MTREELISLTIDKYTDLQRIKKANGNTENKELDYQLKVTIAKLSSLGISVEDSLAIVTFNSYLLSKV